MQEGRRNPGTPKHPGGVRRRPQVRLGVREVVRLEVLPRWPLRPHQQDQVLHILL